MGRHDDGCGGMIWDGQGWVALVAGPGPCERVHGWTGEEAMSKEWEMGLRIFYLPSCRIECSPFRGTLTLHEAAPTMLRSSNLRQEATLPENLPQANSGMH